MVINLAMASLRTFSCCSLTQSVNDLDLIPVDKVTIHYSYSRVNLLCGQGTAVQGRGETSVKIDIPYNTLSIHQNTLKTDFNISINILQYIGQQYKSSHIIFKVLIIYVKCVNLA